MTSTSRLRAICLLVPLVLCTLAATSASADVVHLRSGETLGGPLSPDSLTISSPSQGELGIPVVSIARLRSPDGGPSHDERVAVALTLVDGEQVLATALEKDIDAEEEKSKEVRTTLTVDRAALDRAIEGGTARLLVSLSVRR